MYIDNLKNNFGKKIIAESTKTSLVQNVFSKVSNKYDLMNDIMSFGFHRLWKKRLIEMINLQKNEYIIDVGSGTGDLAKLSNDGFYYIIGRKSRIIKINGYRIDLDFIESELRSKQIYSACNGKDDNLKIYYINKENKSKIFNILKIFKNIKKNNIELFLVKKSNPIFFKVNKGE